MLDRVDHSGSSAERNLETASRSPEVASRAASLARRTAAISWWMPSRQSTLPAALAGLHAWAKISTEHTAVKLVTRSAKTAVPKARPRLLTAIGLLEISATWLAA